MTDRSQESTSESVRVSEVLAALSFALDLTEGQTLGHSLRTCLIGMRISERLGLSVGQRRDLYYALLLKDAGCSSHAAQVFALLGGADRANPSRVDWVSYLKAARFGLSQIAPGASWLERARRIAAFARFGPRVANELVETRASRGAEIVARLGFGAGVSNAVRALDEHWDGSGQPKGIAGEEIPILARIMCLSQALEVYTSVDGAGHALRAALARGGKWFDPALVGIAVEYEHELNRLRSLDGAALKGEVQNGEPGDAALLAGPGALDRIALGFAEVVDAKSPFTAQHSYRMSDLALRIAQRLGYERSAIATLRRAALLHDIGKLSVPNSILDKPGPLTTEEWEVVRLHPYYTQRVLLHIRGFKQVASLAAAHHERLDGRGYFRGLKGSQIALGSQILSTADMFDALTAARPYRPALPEETALRIMERDRDTAVSGACLDALANVVESWDGALQRPDQVFAIDGAAIAPLADGEEQRQAA
ncbi:MAG TPA: HD domain-containing phosphohydrolase [Candidatus Eisenbacteria bacterium]|jgi:HD-GYP domain-containing protein (c-di-GMP phosphodiesterase class II)